MHVINFYVYQTSFCNEKKKPFKEPKIELKHKCIEKLEIMEPKLKISHLQNPARNYNARKLLLGCCSRIGNSWEMDTAWKRLGNVSEKYPVGRNVSVKYLVKFL